MKTTRETNLILAVSEAPGVIDDGDGGIGIIVRQALRDDPDATVAEIVAIVLEAQEEARDAEAEAAEYTVHDSKAGEVLPGWPTVELVRASLSAGPEGHVYAVLLGDEWHHAPQGGLPEPDARRVYVQK